MEPSPYQKAIFEAYETSNDNLLIQACAGSGKTTTLEMLCNRLPWGTRAVALCFARINADQFREKLPSWVQASTMHSLGWGIIRDNVPGAEIDKGKGRRHIEAIWGLKGRPEAEKTFFSKVETLVSLCSMMCIEITGDSALSNLAALVYDKVPDLAPPKDGDEERKDVKAKYTESWYELLSKVQTLQAALRADRTHISFDDMIDHVVFHQLEGRADFDVIMGDEVQDWNRAQAEFVRLLAKKPEKAATSDGLEDLLGEGFMGSEVTGRTTRARLVLVGDRKQAIYGFRGADHNSMDSLKEEFDCKELPLSVCYRCAASVVREAQEIVGDDFIQPREGAPPGEVEHCGHDRRETLDLLPDVSLVVCRANAPLIPAALHLLSNQRKICIRGKDFAVSLERLIDRFSKTVRKAADLPEVLIPWARKEALKREKDGATRSAANLNDMVECILLFIHLKPELRTLWDLKALIRSLFSDDGRNCIVLSSIHKAKGLEEDTVLFIGPEMIPHPMASSDAERDQEMNMKYVAVTRAMRALWYVNAPGRDDPF